MSIKGFEVGGVQAKYDYESLDNIPANLVQDANYVHTDNNYTNADKTKLSGIEAQANKTTIDATLTQSGQAADAKATGDAISALNAKVIANMPHDTASGSIASFPDGAALPVRNLSVDIEPVQAGSGDPSPTNIRPISGWTECKVTRTGKNLFDKSKTGTLGVITWAYESGFLMKANHAYTLSAGSVGSGGLFDSIGIYKTDKTTQLAISYQRSLTYTPASDTLVVFRFYKNPRVTQEAIDTAQLELGSTTSSYESYQSTTYTIDLDGTRYGGSLDVLAGKLTVTDGYIASYNGETLVGPWVSSMDKYEEGATPTTGAQVVDMGGTVTEISLTPEEIETLKGTNNFWSDAGDVSVEYRADTKLYIEKKITAAIAAALNS